MAVESRLSFGTPSSFDIVDLGALWRAVRSPVA